MDIHSLLKDGTRFEHERLEQSLDLLEPHLTKESYVHLLERFAGFFWPFEQRILESQYSSFYKTRTKSPALKLDLQYLGSKLRPSSLNISPMPALSSPEEILGALYVIEGSTLGGQVLSRHFKEKFCLNGGGLNFFEVYGSSTRDHWKSFLEFLNNEYSSKGLQSQNIVSSAKETFLVLGTWLLKKDHA